MAVDASSEVDGQVAVTVEESAPALSDAQIDAAWANRRARLIMFTENNPTEAVPFEFVPSMMEWLCYQKEKGAKGTPHWQGVVYFKNPRGLASCKKLNGRARWMPCDGSAAQNKVYCTKPDGRLEGPFEFGKMPAQGKDGCGGARRSPHAAAPGWQLDEYHRAGHSIYLLL